MKSPNQLKSQDAADESQIELMGKTWRLITPSLWSQYVSTFPRIEEIDRFGRRVKQSPWKGGIDDKIPRNNHWRPYGLFGGGKLLAITAVRLSREDRCLEIQVAYSVDHSPETISAMLAFWLSDAMRCSAELLLRFLDMEEGGRIRIANVPEAIDQFCQQQGVELPFRKLGVIGQREAVDLYRRLLRLDAKTEQSLREQEQMGLIRPGTVAFSVFSGKWDMVDIQFLASLTEQWTVCLETVRPSSAWDLLRKQIDVARQLVLSRLVRHSFSGDHGTVTFDVTSGKWLLTTSASRLANGEPYLPRQWRWIGRNLDSPSETPWQVLFLSHLNSYATFDSQVEQLRVAIENISSDSSSGRKILVTPRDALRISDELQKILIERPQVQILLAPTYQADLDSASCRRLRQSGSELTGAL